MKNQKRLEKLQFGSENTEVEIDLIFKLKSFDSKLTLIELRLVKLLVFAEEL